MAGAVSVHRGSPAERFAESTRLPCGRLVVTPVKLLASHASLPVARRSAFAEAGLERKLHAALAAFANGACSHYVHERTLGEALQLAALRLLETPVGMRATVSSAAELWRLSQAHGLPEALTEDLCALCHLFACVVGRAQLRAELYATTHDHCAKFHVDWYRMRLLCTYFGRGTEVVPDQGVNRAALGAAGELVAINRRIVPDVGRIRRVPAGAIALLKGVRWPEGHGLAAVHRSPSVSAEGSVRLVFKLTAE